MLAAGAAGAAGERGIIGFDTGDHDLGTAFLDKVHKSKYFRKIAQAKSKSPSK